MVLPEDVSTLSVPTQHTVYVQKLLYVMQKRNTDMMKLHPMRLQALKLQRAMLLLQLPLE